MAKRVAPSRKKAITARRSIITLAVSVVIIAVLFIIGCTGLNLDSRGLYKLKTFIPTTNVEKWPSAIPLGLDLRGGVYVEYLAKETEDLGVDFSILLNNTIGVIQNRLTQKGFTEATVTQNGTSGIRVEIPDVTDPLEVLSLIGSPAELEFRDPTGAVILKGSNVKTATVTMYEGKYAVAFKLDAEGTEKFAEATRNNIGKAISIYLDGNEVSAPTVNSAITAGEGVIEGNFTLESAQALAIQIQSGALPLVLTQDKADTVSASLGDNALATSVKAAIIGIALVLLFMALRYRVCGLVADVALVLYIWLVFFLMAALGSIQLTLPGIAGIVLGIGMAVDANVIIFERIEEEVRAGRSVRSAVTTGFKNAFSAIIDSNVTTIIASIVLMIFGTGSIRGFANTLLLSVVVSLLTAVVVTRFLLKHAANLFANHPKLFVRTKKVKEEAAA